MTSGWSAEATSEVLSATEEELRVEVDNPRATDSLQQVDIPEDIQHLSDTDANLASDSAVGAGTASTAHGEHRAVKETLNRLSLQTSSSVGIAAPSMAREEEDSVGTASNSSLAAETEIADLQSQHQHVNFTETVNADSSGMAENTVHSASSRELSSPTTSYNSTNLHKSQPPTKSLNVGFVETDLKIAGASNDSIGSTNEKPYSEVTTEDGATYIRAEGGSGAVAPTSTIAFTNQLMYDLD